MANYAWGWIELTGQDDNLDKFLKVWESVPVLEPGGKSLLRHFIPTPTELFTWKIGWTSLVPDAPDKGFYQMWREIPTGTMNRYGVEQRTLEPITAEELDRLSSAYGAARWTDWQKQNWGCEKGERLWLIGDEQRYEWGATYRTITLKIEAEWRMPYAGLIRLFREGFLPPLNLDLIWYVEADLGAGKFTVNYDEWDRIRPDGTLPEDDDDEQVDSVTP